MQKAAQQKGRKGEGDTYMSRIPEKKDPESVKKTAAATKRERKRSIKGLLTKIILIIVAVSFVTSMAFGVTLGGGNLFNHSANAATSTASVAKSSDLIYGKTLDQYDPSAVKDAPDIDCPHAGVCLPDGTILYQRGADQQVTMASTTKIMTAIVAIETKPLNTTMTVTAGAASVTGSKAGLKAGWTLSLQNLLYCMLLPSGNDAAVCVAENTAGSVNKFCDLMNAKAKALGMDSTVYVDANGLSSNDLTTVNDMMKLTCYAMQNSVFRQVVATTRKSIAVGGTTLNLKNTNQLDEYPTVTGYHISAANGFNILGVKTGTGFKAGSCFIGAVEKDGITMYSVVLGSPSGVRGRFQDTAALLKWAYDHYRAIELLNPTQQVANVSCTAWANRTVAAYSSGNVDTDVFDLAGDLTQTFIPRNNDGGVEAGQVIGTMIWTQDGRQIASCNLIAAADVPAPNIFEGVGQFFAKTASVMFGGSGCAPTTCLLQHQVPVPSAN
jgi:D-alanyl-D-alanine carboxypeptidase (penicillin-binding protein 5/6)